MYNNSVDLLSAQGLRWYLVWASPKLGYQIRPCTDSTPWVLHRLYTNLGFAQTIYPSHSYMSMQHQASRIYHDMCVCVFILTLPDLRNYWVLSKGRIRLSIIMCQWLTHATHIHTHSYVCMYFCVHVYANNVHFQKTQWTKIKFLCVCVCKCMCICICICTHLYQRSSLQCCSSWAENHDYTCKNKMHACTLA